MDTAAADEVVEEAIVVVAGVAVVALVVVVVVVVGSEWLELMGSADAVLALSPVTAGSSHTAAADVVGISSSAEGVGVFSELTVAAIAAAAAVDFNSVCSTFSMSGSILG